VSGSRRLRPARLAPVLLAALLAGCTGGGTTRPTTPPETLPTHVRTLHDLTRLGQNVSLLVPGGQAPDDAVQTGKGLLAFDLTDDRGFVTGGSPLLYLATKETAKPIGPFRATWTELTGYDETGDTSPRTPLPGVYWAEVDVPEAGLYTIVALARRGTGRAVGVAHAYFADDVQHAVGSKAVSFDTPVATTPKEIRRICTRKPPDDLHSISLADALANGKPTVVQFGTPLLCSSQMCGPVLDEVILASRHVGSRANFVHVEEFLPGADLQPPPADLQHQSPAFKAWRLTTEPWTFVIDGGGVIRARFEGPVVAAEVEAALQPLL
jgi:hypothetical protein